MKSKKDLYIYNSDSLIKLAETEGNDWLEIQKKEFYGLNPRPHSFAYALKMYEVNKNFYTKIYVISIIDGKINNYEVLGNGLIKNESKIFS